MDSAANKYAVIIMDNFHIALFSGAQYIIIWWPIVLSTRAFVSVCLLQLASLTSNEVSITYLHGA